MQLSGKHIVNAAPAKVWAMLMDTDTLAKIVPGISSLEKTDENKYKSTVSIKLGPVGASFTGNLSMEDVVEEKSFTMNVQQNSKVGNANAVLKINLNAVSDNQTEVSFDGDVKLSGMLASMGQRVLAPVSNTLSKQFFTNMEREIEEEAPSP